MSTTPAPLFLPLLAPRERSPEVPWASAMQKLNTSAAGRVVKVKSASQNTTSNDFADIADLEFPIGANQNWHMNFDLLTACDGSDGINVAISGPAGATLRVATVGVSNSVNSGHHGQLVALDDPSKDFNAYNGDDGDIRVFGTVKSGSTAGIIKIRFRVVTAGETGTIIDGSGLVANKAT